MMIAKSRLPSYLTQQQVRQLFATISNPRDRALFSLCYAYGLRVGEIVLLNRDDLDLERERIRIRRLKGGLSGERPIFRSLLPVPRKPKRQGRRALHGSAGKA
jgi:integrase